MLQFLSGIVDLELAESKWMLKIKFLSDQMELKTYEKFVNNGIAYSSNTNGTTSVCGKTNTDVLIET